jgi:hypothetical protein
MIIAPAKRLEKAEVIKRLKRFREALGMSRREFGNLDHIRQRGEVIGIHTDKHTMYIPVEAWDELGKDDGAESVMKKIASH